MGGQSKLMLEKVVPKPVDTMNRSHDRIAVEFWKSQKNLDMTSHSKWSECVQKLRTMNVRVTVQYIKNRWITEIDPWLETGYSVKIDSREDLGYQEDMASSEKFRIMTERMSALKMELGRRMDADLDDVEQPLQDLPLAKLKRVVDTEAVVHKSLANVSNPESAIDTCTALNEDRNSMGRRRYTIELENPLPLSFRKCKQGAQSVDVRGFKLPEQLFQGHEFYLLDGDYTGDKDLLSRGLANSLEWMIKVHGGSIIVDKDDIRAETIVLGSCDEAYNADFFAKTEGKIHKSKLVYFHVKEQMYITKSNLEFFEMDIEKLVRMQDQKEATAGVLGELQKSVQQDVPKASFPSGERTETVMQRALENNGEEQVDTTVMKRKLEELSGSTVATTKPLEEVQENQSDQPPSTDKHIFEKNFVDNDSSKSAKPIRESSPLAKKDEIKPDFFDKKDTIGVDDAKDPSPDSQLLKIDGDCSPFKKPKLEAKAEKFEEASSSKDVAKPSLTADMLNASPDEARKMKKKNALAIMFRVAGEFRSKARDKSAFIRRVVDYYERKYDDYLSYKNVEKWLDRFGNPKEIYFWMGEEFGLTDGELKAMIKFLGDD